LRLIEVDWDAEPPGLVSLSILDRWANIAKSLLAKVPSMIVPEEFNYLVNPLHPDVGEVKVTVIQKWFYDPRIQ
jgi:hypothetical protein